MEEHFKLVKKYLTELNYTITDENPEDGIILIEKEQEGIKNMMIGCAFPILIMEQFIFDIKTPSAGLFQDLLKKNRDIIHGAFVLDESGTKVIFRDTLQLESLDINEIESSINSLSLMLSEYSNQIINFSKQ